MTKTDKNLNDLKKNYEDIRTKFALPSFDELNKDFSIEKVAENESDFLIREIRKIIGDKLLGYLRFIENLLNPVNVPLFVFSLVKLLDADEKKKLSEIYKDLVKIEIKFIELDLEFDEEKEAEFIKDSYKFWQATKKNLLSLMEGMKDKFEGKSESTNKGYFG